MRFWDTSGLIPLLAEQEASEAMRALLEEDREIAAWWGTPVECASAAARLRREGIFTAEDESALIDLLARLRATWLEILPSNELRDEALRALRVHALRAGDALQLASALVWSGRSAGHVLVTLDERFRLAARLEGFKVLPAKL
jgi:predicted nucleic acid-binding protein